MTRPNSVSQSSFPLAAGSRGRRRLLLQQAGAYNSSGDDAGDVDSVSAETDGARAAEALERNRFAICDRNPAALEISRLLLGSTPINWVFTGDSITHGSRYTRGSRSYCEHFSERVRWELRRLLDVVINTGISGARSRNLLNNLDERVLRFQPDVVSIMIGMNDALSGQSGRLRFRDNLQKIVEVVRDADSIVLLSTPNWIAPKDDERRADLPAYVEIIREVANTDGVLLADHWEHWTRLQNSEQPVAKWLAGDGIHPNRFGHRELAKLVFNRLGIFDPRSPTCAAKVP